MSNINNEIMKWKWSYVMKEEWGERVWYNEEYLYRIFSDMVMKNNMMSNNKAFKKKFNSCLLLSFLNVYS